MNTYNGKILLQIPTYMLSKLVVGISMLIHYLVTFGSVWTGRSRNKGRASLLAVESGEMGWALIEYEELLKSANEYLGPSKVIKIAISERKNYIWEVRELLSVQPVTHYLYDPRTGSQGWIKGLVEVFSLVVLFAQYRVIPIARLSDFPHRRWRFLCATLTSSKGICSTLMASTQMKGYFPHRRLIGPMMMALSNTTVLRLIEVKSLLQSNEYPRAIFTGALYEPRTSFLDKVKECLRLRGLELEMHTRELGSERDSNISYWQRLLAADIVLTTADQSIGPGKEIIDITHMVYRYSEVLAAGAMLLAPLVPGIEKYFRPGVDFIVYTDWIDAANKIEYYLGAHSERRGIALSGSARLSELTQSHSYWRTIDFALGVHGFS